MKTQAAVVTSAEADFSIEEVELADPGVGEGSPGRRPPPDAWREVDRRRGS